MAEWFAAVPQALSRESALSRPSDLYFEYEKLGKELEMILGAEIGLLVMGLWVLIKGEYPIAKGKKLRGGGARLCGVLCLLPIPVSVLVGFVMGFVLVANGTDMQQLQRDAQRYGLVIEIGVLVLVVVVVSMLGKSLYRKQVAAETAAVTAYTPPITAPSELPTPPGLSQSPENPRVQVVECNSCGTRVMPMNDGACPNCQSQIA